jgi:hypothetical protein
VVKRLVHARVSASWRPASLHLLCVSPVPVSSQLRLFCFRLHSFCRFLCDRSLGVTQDISDQ